MKRRSLPIPRRAITFIQRWLGRPAWEVKWDNQAGLWLCMGTPRVEITEPRYSISRKRSMREAAARRRARVDGTHRLWVEATAWNITAADGMVANRRSSQIGQRATCARLHGERPIEIAIDTRTGETWIFFDLGGTLHIPRHLFKNTGYHGTVWDITDPRRSFGIAGGPTYVFESIHTPLEPDLNVPLGAHSTAERYLRITSRRAVLSANSGTPKPAATRRRRKLR